MPFPCWPLARVKGFGLGLAVVLLGLVARLPIRADEAAQTGTGMVARLIAQLGSRKYAERQAATRALDTLGSVALPALKEAVHSPDAEVRHRARKLVKTIGLRVEMEQLLAPTRVHLVCRDQAVSRVVADLARQSGVALDLDGNPAAFARRKLTLDTGRTTFWEALDQLCRKAKLVERGLMLAEAGSFRQPVRNPRLRPRQDACLLLVDGKPRQLPTCYARGMRIRALPPTVPLTGLSRTGRDRVVVLEAALEPKARLHNLVGLKVHRAIDERGIHVSAVGQVLRPPTNPYQARALSNQLIPAYVDRLESGMVGGNFRRLLLHAEGTRVLKELRGTLIAEVQKPSEPLATIKDVLKAAGKTFDTHDGESLTVVKVERGGKGQVTTLHIDSHFTLRGFRGSITLTNSVIRIRRTPTGQWETIGLRASNIKLLDTRGRPLALTAMRRMGFQFGPGGITQKIQLTFAADKDQAEPARLVYFGVRTILVEVPFTLTNVPLS